jgi:hypothetical protein
MKKLLIIILIAFGLNANAQITLEHTYDSASTFMAFGSGVSTNSQLMIIKFEISGERYVKINRWGKVIEVFNINHSLVKTISLQSLVTNPDIGDIMYISEQLFDTDPDIDYMYCTSSPVHTSIYNEDGTLLFSDSAGPAIRFNIPVQQLPIYNTSQGTKMILSYENPDNSPGPAKVYNLPGTLTEGIAEANNNLIAMQTQSIVSDAYPNPTNNTTQIDYIFPEGINEGEIVFYDLMGNEVKRFKVDKTFNTLLVSTADIAAGTYYYQLQTTTENSEGKKMVVIK